MLNENSSLHLLNLLIKAVDVKYNCMYEKQFILENLHQVSHGCLQADNCFQDETVSVLQHTVPCIKVAPSTQGHIIWVFVYPNILPLNFL